MSTTREVVYSAIDGERDYQDQKWGNDQHSLLEWLVFIEDYSAEAKHFTIRNPDPEAFYFLQHSLRKIAGLAVCALEQHGVMTRGREEFTKAEMAVT